MIKVVKDFVKSNKIQLSEPVVSKNELMKVQLKSGIKLSARMMTLLEDLSKIKQRYDLNHIIMCDSVTPAKFSIAGGERRSCSIGFPVIELSKGRLFDWSPYEVGPYEHLGRTGKLNELYPLVLTEESEGMESFICIDYMGNVVNFNVELDASGASVLANNQDEFVKKLYLKKIF